MNTKLAQTILCEHLSLRKETARAYILTLELCGLIYVNRKHREVNEIFILQPTQLFDSKTNTLNQAALDKIQQQVIELSGYDSLKKTLLGRLADFKSLFQRLEHNKQPDVIILTKQSELIPTAAPTPQAESADLPRQTELIAYMTATFHDGKKPLSEAAAIKMIETYGLAAVEQQISWLERRNTDNPLRTLRAALKDDWNEPKPVGNAKAEPFTPAEKAVMMARTNEPNEVETEPALSLPLDDPMPVPDAIPDPAAMPIAPAPEAPPPDLIWQEVKERLRMQLSQATYDSWVRPTELAHIEGNRWFIECESTFAQDWLENRLNGTLTRTVKGVVGHEVELQFIIRQAPLSLSQMNES